MKIVATRAMRVGNRRLEEGEEIDLPDRFARQLLSSGHATEAVEKKSAAKKKAEEPEDNRKTYKTRQVKAEDND